MARTKDKIEKTEPAERPATTYARPKRVKKLRTEDELDDILDHSFPASDPPSFNPGRASACS